MRGQLGDKVLFITLEDVLNAPFKKKKTLKTTKQTTTTKNNNEINKQIKQNKQQPTYMASDI